MTMQKLKEMWTFRFRDDMLFSEKSINALLLPAILETILSYLIGLVDSAMVASVGEAAISAVSMVDSISVLFINIFAALATGGAVVCGQYLGQRNQRQAQRSAEQMTVLLLGISLVITAALMIWQNQLIDGLYGSVEADVRSNCITYYHIVMLSVPFIALYNGGSSLFRTVGDSATPLKISIVMNVINVVGNALLIFVFKMGVAGVAIPTLVSRGVGMGIILFLTLKRNFALNICEIRSYTPDRKLIRNIMAIGIPNGIENGMFQFGKLILMTLVATLSTASLTANAIGNTLGPLHVVAGMASNVALMAVISRCAGANDFEQARWYMRYFMKRVYIIQGATNLVMIAAIPLILRMYQVSEETAKLAVPIFLVHGIASILIWAPAFMLNIGMRAAGDSQYAMWIGSISMWLCRVGGSYLLVRGFHMGVIGVWIAWDIDWLFRIAFFVPRYIGHKWETKSIR